MATQYAVKKTDRLLRFDTTKDDVVVTLLAFGATPNAPYEVHKTSVGDGHTVTIVPDPATTDFILPDGSNVVLDDTNNTAIVKIPADGSSPAFVSMGGISSGSGNGGTTNVPAPNVTITGPAEIFFRDNNQLEVDLEWAPASNATAVNFQGVHVYLEDPDISTGPNMPLDGTALLDGTRQASGQWTPVFVNDSLPSPGAAGGTAVLLFVASAPGAPAIRNVRIYLAAYGPYSQPKLVRANTSGATPNIMVEIAQGPSSYQSGMEWAFNVTAPKVAVATDYNRPDPQYYLTFTYTPPDPSIPLPSGVNQFGGCRIVFVQEDSSGNPIFPGADTGLSVPVAQSQTGFKSPAYSTAAGGTQFRAYFCSEDNATPLGSHINSLVEGVTPFAEVSVPLVAPAPDVTNFTISGETIIYLLNQTFVAQAVFAWSLPAASAGGVRYAGVFLYLVKVAAGGVTQFPAKLSGQQSNVDTGFTLDIANVPPNPEVWTVAAISVDVNGHLSDDPTKFGQASFHSPTVTWNIGPPVPGSPGSSTQYAPLVTVNAGAAAVATQGISADGVGMVSFAVSSWTNPTDPKFGGAQVAMVINKGDPTKATYWSVPANATSFQTPAMASFGNIGGAAVPVDFYIVSDDPQGHKNPIETVTAPTTPVISVAGGYVPTAGAIIPARSGWFDPTQFTWVNGDVFTGQSFSANIIQVGSKLIVGGAAGSAAASFGGNTAGQIAVLDGSGRLLDWLGQQQNGQGDNSAIWGAWLGQVWIGGTSPLTAPVFVDYQGVIQVGGIAAQKGSTYPYISVRDQTGLEAGRIGAMISSSTDSSGNVGGNPPQLTAGAWFTQLAVGGSNLSNWNVLITPDVTNPLGSNFQMRNINLLSIDYAALAGNPARNEYKLEFGNSVWMGGGLPSGVWQFPGIHIYEVDGNANPNFGATFINRGMVLRGTARPSGESSPVYPVLVSLSTWNGDQGGSDFPAQFFGTLAMYSPLSPYNVNVLIASGSYSSPTTDGNAYMYLHGTSGNMLFSADLNACTAISFSTVAHGQVIDSAGNWHGQPIAGSQTPWTSDIAGAGHNLSNVGSIQVNGAVTASSLTATAAVAAASASITGLANAANFQASSIDVINNLGQFIGHGVNMPAQGVGCNSLSIYYSGTVQAQATVQQGVENLPSAVSVYFLNITNSGANAALMVNGNQVIDYTGIYIGRGVQSNAAIYGSSFGIYGVSVGASGSFTTANGKTVTVNGGIITSIA